jgi:heptosyltransferase I
MEIHDHVRDVCIVLLTGIGDVAHGLPVANAIKDDDPRRRITWVAEPAPAEVLRAHPSVDRVVVFRKSDGLRGVTRLREDLAGSRFDLAINMQRHMKGVIPTLLCGAPIRLGLDRDKVRENVWRFSNRHIEPAPWAHTQDMLLRFLDAMGIERPDPLEWRITFSEDERSRQRAFFAGLPGAPVVGLVLGSNVSRKDWPAERYAELADAIAGSCGATILLVGGPAERERAAARLIRDRARCEPVSTLADDVRRMMWVVEGCDLLVSPDSGPLHLAHAFDVPVVGLYGHTNPARVGPYLRFRDLVVDAYHDPGEAPDPSRTAPRHGRMERITVSAVLERVHRAFEDYVSPRAGHAQRTSTETRS